LAETGLKRLDETVSEGVLMGKSGWDGKILKSPADESFLDIT
jgi:hypothetical protein